MESTIHTLDSIVLDFYRNNYVVVTAKQYDNLARQINISLTDRGSFYFVNQNYMYATVQSVSPSGVSRFETVDINGDGTLTFTLQNYHLDTVGDINMEIIIFNSVDNSRLAAVDFTIHVLASNYKGIESDILESDQYAALTDAMNTALKEYDEVITETKGYAKDAENYATQAQGSATAAANSANAAANSANISYENAQLAAQSVSSTSDNYNLSKSYAIGTDNVIRDGDATDNSKYYSQVASTKATDATDTFNAIVQQYQSLTSEMGGITFSIDMDTGILSYAGNYDLSIDYDPDNASGTGVLYYTKG